MARPGLTNDADVRSLASNALLRLFDSLYEGAVVVDRAGRITWINDKYKALIGWNGADPVEGRMVEEVIPNSRLRHVMESGRAELLDVFAIGSRQVVVSRIPLQDESGVVIGGLGVILYDRVQALKPIVSKFQQLQADLASARRELAETRQAKYRFSQMVGLSTRLRDVKEQARRAAERDATVLLLGETGTGKELMAHAIHGASKRADKPLVGLNAAAIPETLLESELFGVEPGAYTGAGAKPRPGKFQLADGGTLFLDEVGDMPLMLQAKLLRVLQEGEVEPIGSNRLRSIDVRVIAATSRDLKAMVDAGSFRADLYYRLNVLPIRLPPLRERGEDIALLAKHFLAKRIEEEKRPPQEFTKSSLELISHYPWPGNVREMENIIEQAFIWSKGSDVITPEHLPNILRTDTRSTSLRDDTLAGRLSLEKAVMEFEREIILDALKRTTYVQTHAAAMLGISRRMLKYRMDTLGISRPDNGVNPEPPLTQE